MSQAKQMYRDLMNMLLPLLPRSVYGDTLSTTSIPSSCLYTEPVEEMLE